MITEIISFAVGIWIGLKIPQVIAQWRAGRILVAQEILKDNRRKLK